MRKSFVFASAIVALAPIACAHAGQDDFSGVIAARQGQFHILDYNLGILEQMVSDKLPYEQDVAENRAENVQMATRLNQDRNWLPGSDLPPVHGTRAIGIRANPAIFKAKWGEMMKRADSLQAVSGGGVEAMAPAVAAMRETCQSCHEFYRPKAEGAKR